MAVYDVFTPECLNDLFPIQRTNDFFDALFGDAEEGAYDIRLVVDPEESDDGELHFYFELHQRAGRCLVCSLTSVSYTHLPYGHPAPDVHLQP